MNINKTKIVTLLGIALVVIIIIIKFANKKNNINKAVKAETGTISKSTHAKSYPSGRILRVTVGAIVSPASTLEYYHDLFRLIGDKLYRETVFLERNSYDDVNNLIEKMDIDLAFVYAGPYLEGEKKFGMEILAVPVLHQAPVYYSYIIVNKNSPVNSLEKLRGKKFAFVDPYSNTGCLIPEYMLIKRNESPETFFKETFYTYSHDKSIQIVAENKADGAAVDSLLWDYMSNTDSTYTSKTKIIEKSPPYGIHPIVINPSIDPELKKELKDILFSLHNDPEGKVLLKKLQIDAFIEGSDSTYISLKELVEYLEKQKKFEE